MSKRRRPDKRERAIIRAKRARIARERELGCLPETKVKSSWPSLRKGGKVIEPFWNRFGAPLS